MIDKQLRILIVDALHAHVLLIEKMLNRMGYYAIATAGSAPPLAPAESAALRPPHCAGARRKSARWHWQWPSHTAVPAWHGCIERF